jgi:hypothetical protein
MYRNLDFFNIKKFSFGVFLKKIEFVSIYFKNFTNSVKFSTQKKNAAREIHNWGGRSKSAKFLFFFFFFFFFNVHLATTHM